MLAAAAALRATLAGVDDARRAEGNGPARGVLGGFASPSESLSWGPNDSLHAIARALRVQGGTLPPLGDAEERPGTPLPNLPDDFGSLPGDD